MKRFRILGLMAALLALLLLGSCAPSGSVGTLQIKDVLDTKSPFEPEAPYKPGEKLTALQGLSANSNNYIGDGSLVYLYNDAGEYDQHVVYNLKTNQVVISWVDSEFSEHSFSLECVYDEVSYNTLYDYIVVEKWEEDEAGNEKTTTILLDENGIEIARADGEEEVRSVADLIYFDGTFYGKGTDGIKKQFDWAPFARIPDVNSHFGDYYYEFGGNSVTVYDAELQPVSHYEVPALASGFYYESMPVMALLGNGNILVQYGFRLPEGSTEYTALRVENDALIPYDITTVIVNAKDGSTKEIACEYVIGDCEYLDEELAAAFGLKSDVIFVAFGAYRIMEGRFDTDNEDSMVFLFADTKGNFKEMAEFEGEKSFVPERIAEDRWLVRTDTRVYLINGKAEVIAEVTTAVTGGNTYDWSEAYLVADGKIYNYDLEELIDYEVKELAIFGIVGNVALFTNENGDLLRWTGSGEPVLVISGTDARRHLVGSSMAYNGYVVYDEDTELYTLYSATGETLIAANAQSYYGSPFTSVAYADDVILVKAQTYNEETGRVDTVYYRLAK